VKATKSQRNTGRRVFFGWEKNYWKNGTKKKEQKKKKTETISNKTERTKYNGQFLRVREKKISLERYSLHFVIDLILSMQTLKPTDMYVDKTNSHLIS